MIQILTTTIKAEMSMAEASALFRLLGRAPLDSTCPTTIDLTGFSAAERQALRDIYIALCRLLECPEAWDE